VINVMELRMAAKEKALKDGEFHLSLEGGGLSLDRIVNEAVAQHIVAIVMTGAAPAPAPVGFAPGASRLGAAPALQGGVTAKAFMAEKRPATDIEKVACLAYYLSKYRDVAGFKTKELTELNREAAQVPLSNASATARNAVSEKYLAPHGGGKKQITVRGEALVEALPDREAVKAALEQHAKGKRRKASAKKAKK